MTNLVSFFIALIHFLISSICLTIVCIVLVFLGQTKIFGLKIYRLTINNSFITNVINLFILFCIFFTLFNLIFYIINFILVPKV